MPENEDKKEQQENRPSLPFVRMLKSFDDYQPSKEAIDGVTEGLLPKGETPPKSEN